MRFEVWSMVAGVAACAGRHAEKSDAVAALRGLGAETPAVVLCDGILEAATAAATAEVRAALRSAAASEGKGRTGGHANTGVCPVPGCGAPSAPYQHRLHELFRPLCVADRMRAQAFHTQGRAQGITPEEVLRKVLCQPRRVSPGARRRRAS